MPFRIGLENNIERHSLAWALEHPGCFAAGPSPEAALQALPKAIQTYAQWIHQHTSQPWVALESTDFVVEETWEVFTIDGEYELADEGNEINAWFLHDWKPLTVTDIKHGLQLLAWSRESLIESVAGMSEEERNVTAPGQRWSINGILQHVGGAEWWYLDRLGLAFKREEIPADPFLRLETVRRRLNETLPGLEGDEVVLGVEGEFWSPRKLLRRAVWHELDHAAHIRSLRED